MSRFPMKACLCWKAAARVGELGRRWGLPGVATAGVHAAQRFPPATCCPERSAVCCARPGNRRRRRGSRQVRGRRLRRKSRMALRIRRAGAAAAGDRRNRRPVRPRNSWRRRRIDRSRGTGCRGCPRQGSAQGPNSARPCRFRRSCAVGWRGRLSRTWVWGRDLVRRWGFRRGVQWPTIDSLNSARTSAPRNRTCHPGGRPSLPQPNRRGQAYHRNAAW